MAEKREEEDEEWEMIDDLEDLDEWDIFGDDTEFTVEIDLDEEPVKKIKREEAPVYEDPTGTAKTKMIKNIFENAQEGMMIGSKGGFTCKEIADTKFGYEAECIWDLEESGLMIEELRASPLRRFYSGDHRTIILNNDYGHIMYADFQCDIEEDCMMTYETPDLVQTDHESKKIHYNSKRALLKVSISGESDQHSLHFQQIPKE